MKTSIQSGGEETAPLYSNLPISSQAVGQDGFILSQYTCSGANISPPLDIAGIPKAAKSLAIIVDDPDAPHANWVHWVAWNIPVVRHIREARQMEEQGVNDFRQSRYDGPCPPEIPPKRTWRRRCKDTSWVLGNWSPCIKNENWGRVEVRRSCGPTLNSKWKRLRNLVAIRLDM
jgi:hypothetical protein